MGLDRDCYCVVSEDACIGVVLLLPEDLGGRGLTDSFREFVAQGGSGNLREKPIRVLIVNPLLKPLVGGIHWEKIDYSGDREGPVLVADVEPQDCLLTGECVEKKSVPQT